MIQDFSLTKLTAYRFDIHVYEIYPDVKKFSEVTKVSSRSLYVQPCKAMTVIITQYCMVWLGIYLYTVLPEQKCRRLTKFSAFLLIKEIISGMSKLFLLVSEDLT